MSLCVQLFRSSVISPCRLFAVSLFNYFVRCSCLLVFMHFFMCVFSFVLSFVIDFVLVRAFLRSFCPFFIYVCRCLSLFRSSGLSFCLHWSFVLSLFLVSLLWPLLVPLSSFVAFISVRHVCLLSCVCCIVSLCIYFVVC